MKWMSIVAVLLWGAAGILLMHNGRYEAGLLAFILSTLIMMMERKL